jgi:hypothetical protein
MPASAADRVVVNRYALRTALGRGEHLRYVDEGSLFAVGFCRPEYLPSDGGDLAAAEDEVAQQVRHWAAFGPVEVDVWAFTGEVAHV